MLYSMNLYDLFVPHHLLSQANLFSLGTRVFSPPCALSPDSFIHSKPAKYSVYTYQPLQQLKGLSTTKIITVTGLSGMEVTSWVDWHPTGNSDMA